MADRTVMLTFSGSVSGLMASTKAASSLIDNLIGRVTNIGRSLGSALGGDFKPLMKTVVGGVMAFAKVLLLIPSFMLALVSPVSVAKMALADFGSAVSATSPEAFVGATRNMAPAMKDAVMSVRLLTPMLKNLRGTIQQGFWAGFSTDITQLANIYFPILNKGLGSIGTTLGNLRHQFIQFLVQPQVVAAITAWMDAFSGLGGPILNLVTNLMPTMLSLFTSFAQILIAIVPLVAALASAFSHLLTFVAPVIAGIGSVVSGTSGVLGSSGGTGSSSTGGFFSNLARGVGNFFSGIFGGARATGGPVFAGRSYLVGERGPEMLSMGANGTITPGQQSGASNVFVTVKIGETELEGIISRKIEQMSQNVALASRMGRGQVI